MPLASTVVSLDIDGTMSFGDPPGPVTLEIVRSLLERGAIVGSASDRAMADQANLWQRHGVVVAFVGHKHRLDQVRARFVAERWIHIGDSTADEQYARVFDFEFHHVDLLATPGSPGWIW